MNVQSVLRFTVDDEKLRDRMLKEIRALRHPPLSAYAEQELIDEIIQELSDVLREKEQQILNELVAAKKIGLGLGMGPGGGPYTYIMLDQITPEFVRDIIRGNEGTSLYDLVPQCEGEAASLFREAWAAAIKNGLQQRLFFRNQNRYYTDERVYLQDQADSKARRGDTGERRSYRPVGRWLLGYRGGLSYQHR